jgi:hypothetical protein
MKMTIEHFEALRKACKKTRDKHLHITPNSYIENNIGKDPVLRFRWDLFHASRRKTGYNFSEYLDSHIDTALRRIVKELYG